MNVERVAVLANNCFKIMLNCAINGNSSKAAEKLVSAPWRLNAYKTKEYVYDYEYGSSELARAAFNSSEKYLPRRNLISRGPRVITRFLRRRVKRNRLSRKAALI
jgi:hypothetical protein